MSFARVQLYNKDEGKQKKSCTPCTIFFVWAVFYQNSFAGYSPASTSDLIFSTVAGRSAA